MLDERRLNVAITRPKYFLMIVGNAKTLKKSEIWEGMIDYCEKQGRLIIVPGRNNFESMQDFKKCVLPQFIDWINSNNTSQIIQNNLNWSENS